MNQNQRDTLLTCLTQVFGRVEDAFVDAAVPMLRWIELSGGETLMKEGDAEDGVYFVITGRLKAFVTREGELRPIGEIGRGETVGEMGVLTGEPRSATVVAIRDTVLAHASRAAFEELWHRHPQLPVHMARIVIERLKRSARARVRRPSTICLLAVTDGIDLPSFAESLVRSLDRWGVATMETRERIDARFGEGAADVAQRDSEAYHRVTTWLDDVEFWNEFVLLVTDDADSEWTRRCLRHADEVLLIARASAPPEIHDVERRLCMGDDAITGARQTLVLLHDENEGHPSRTSRWLDRRPVDVHFHIRPTLRRDMARLARIVSGNAIGLVLAGGGARGFAHLGVYKALEEAGIQVDFVGGTSIGSVMATYVALDQPADKLIRYGRKDFAGNPTGDVNLLPLVSLIKGRRIKSAFERGVIDISGSKETDVADSWRTLYCVATNYSSAREMVITRGRLDRAMRASVSIPVALPPVLWQGELLIDGGVFNNFPTDIMARMGARRIIGVDLARPSSRRYEFEEIPGTWDLLMDRFRGRKTRRYKLPSLGGFLMGTTILYSESRREQARQSVDLYLNPELGGIGLLEWKAFDRIVEIGYQHTREVLAALPERELALYRNEEEDQA